MHKEQIVGIAVRLFAVFLGVYVLRYSSGVIPYVAKSSEYAIGIPFLVAVVVIPILIVVLLWAFPLTIASKLIPGVKTEEQPKAMSGLEAEIIAFSVLGLWVLATAVPDVFHWATFVYLTISSGVGRSGISPEQIGNIISTGVELAIGFWLLLGSKGVVGIVRRMRDAKN